MKPKQTLLVISVLGIAPLAAQSTLDWRTEATNGNWNDSNNWWSGAAVSPPGSEILRFDNNNQLTMTNDASNTTRHRIIFAAGATSSRTIGGSTVNNFVAVAGNGALIQNNSSATHTLNFPISVGSDGLTLDTVTNAFNFGGTISGSGTITKSGGSGNYTGALNVAITGVNSSFTGKWVVNGGNLSINSDAALGAAPGAPVADSITLNGGSLSNMSAAGGTGFGAGHDLTLNANRGITLGSGGGNIRIGYGKTVTINGAITGTGNLTHTDGGTLVLAGTSNFIGNLTNSAGNLTVSGALNHTGNLVNGAGTLVFSGSSGSTYTGYTHLSNSTTLRLDANNVMPDGTDLLMYGGTTFNVNGKNETVGGLMVGGSTDTTATVNLGGTGATGTLTVTDTSMPAGAPTNVGASFYAKITGTGGVNYAHSTGSTTSWDWLNTANDFTGNVTITSGRLRTALGTGGIGAFGNAANDLVFNGDVVSTLGNGEGKASLQGAASGALNLGADRSIILNTGKEGTMYVWGGNTYTINGKVTGGGNLRKEDGGTLLLANAANDYTGLTRIANGTIKVGVAGAIPDASGIEIAGGNLDLNSLTESAASLIGTGGAVNGGGTLTVLTSGTSSYSGVIQSATTLQMAGTGTQTIAGTSDNVNGWAAVSSGTLVLGKTSSAAAHSVGRSFGTGLTISGGTARLGGSGNDQIYLQTDVSQTAGVFDFNGTNEGFRALTGTGGTVRNGAASTTSTMTLGESSLVTDSFSYSGVIENGAGTMALTKTGAGSQTLSGANTYTGNTTINGGTLTLGSGGSIAGSSTITVAAGATLNVSATGAWTLGAAQTLTGSGTLVGNSTIGGDLRVGSSPGALTVTGDLGLNSGSDWHVELGGTAALDYDRLLVSGALTANGNILVSFYNGYTPAASDSFQIATFSSFSGTPGFDFTAAPLGAGLSWDTSQFGTNGTIGVIPEPASAILLGLGSLGLALRRRRP